MGSFQMRTLKHVGTEMSLHVHNMKRVMNLLATLIAMTA